MKRLKNKIVLQVILLVVPSLFCAQSHPQYPTQIKSDGYSQEQIRNSNPSTEDPEKEISASTVLTKNRKAIGEKTENKTAGRSQFPCIIQVKTTDQSKEQIREQCGPISESSNKEVTVPKFLTKNNKEVFQKTEPYQTAKNKYFSNESTSVYSKTINTNIGGESDLPAILMGIVVAYLTILISVAIAIFSEKKAFEVLDRNVILDHIIKSKYLLACLILTLFPLLFWNFSYPWIRLLEIIFWLFGVIYITKILINSYHWMKGNKFQLRFSYLRELGNRQDMEEAWRSVWQTENINSQNEQEFFNIFHSTLDRLLTNGK